MQIHVAYLGKHLKLQERVYFVILDILRYGRAMCFIEQYRRNLQGVTATPQYFIFSISNVIENKQIKT